MSDHAVHGGDFFKAIGVTMDQLSRRHDVINADVLDAWYDPAPAVISTIREHLAWLIKTSPPTYSEGLRERIAFSRRILPEQVLVDSGSSPLILRLVPRLFGGKRIGLLDPTYGEFPHQLSRCGGEPVFLELPAPFFSAPIDRLIDFAKGLDGLILVNPNSPTGISYSLLEIKSLVESLDASKPVLIDETYIDFLPGRQSAEGLVADHPNLVIVKSMSKFYGLSGLRVGYMVGSTALIQELEPDVPPWSVALIAQVAAIAALADEDYYLARRDETVVLRRELQASLTAVGFEVCPSATNFVMFKTTSVGAAELCSRCEKQGLFLRNCDSLSPRFKDQYVRTAVKEKETNEKILAILGKA